MSYDTGNRVGLGYAFAFGQEDFDGKLITIGIREKTHFE